jgi:hypothetical protein
MKNLESENSRVVTNNSQMEVKDTGAAGAKKGPPAKVEPKKDLKPAPGKPATAEDKNAPKDIKIDYPEVEIESDYLIIEKSYKQMKPAPKVVV